MKAALAAGLATATMLLAASTSGCAPTRNCIRDPTQVGQAMEREQESLRLSQQSFRESAAALGYQVREFPVKVVTLPYPQEGKAPKWPEGVFTGDVYGQNGTYLRLKYGSPMDNPPNIVRVFLLVDKEGTLHEAIHQAKPVNQRAIILCGCGDPGGGAVEPDRAAFAILPSDAKLGDAVAVSYNFDDLRVQHDFLMDDGSHCTAPP
ncbi:MAG: hypothetical protein IPK82_31275 [Polyangiaceae bacterium]|nr:hypothetical protein [Polyangiaceae bacterium]